MMTMSAVMWQETLNNQDVHWLMIFVGLTTFAMLVQALTVVGMFFQAKKLKTDLMELIHETKSKVMPIVEKSDALITELTPKVNAITAQVEAISLKVAAISVKAEVIAGHAEEITALVNSKAHEFAPTVDAARQTLESANQTVRDANARAQGQLVRVNGMVTSVLDATEEAGKSIQRGISVPVREVSGILSGIKAGFFTFLNGKPKPMPPMYRPPVGFYEGSGERDKGLQSD